MKSRLCERLGIPFPLFAFSHCRDVVAAVSKAGGFGVLGVVGHTAESVAIELDWLDAQVGDAPYGVDLIVPNNIDAKEGGLTAEQIEARIPPEHKAHVERILTAHGIDTSGLWAQGVQAGFGDNMRETGAAGVLQEALRRPNMRMVVNALGVPPPFIRRSAAAKPAAAEIAVPAWPPPKASYGLSARSRKGASPPCLRIVSSRARRPVTILCA